MDGKKENSEEQAERNAAAVKEAWRGAWLIVFMRAPIILAAQAGLYALYIYPPYWGYSVPEWLTVVLTIVLSPLLLILVIFVFLVLPFIISWGVNALVNDIMERERMGGVAVFEKVKTFGLPEQRWDPPRQTAVAVFEKVKTFGLLTSIFFIFGPTFVLKLCCFLYFEEFTGFFDFLWKFLLFVVYCIDSLVPRD